MLIDKKTMVDGKVICLCALRVWSLLQHGNVKKVSMLSNHESNWYNSRQNEKIIFQPFSAEIKSTSNYIIGIKGKRQRKISEQIS